MKPGGVVYKCSEIFLSWVEIPQPVQAYYNRYLPFSEISSAHIMQPKFFLALALAGTPIALVVRQLATIESAFDSIETALENLDTAVNAITGDDAATEAAAVESASSDLLTTLSDATTTVEGATAVDDTDAITLASDAQNLNTEVTTVIDDLVAKESIIEANGYTADVCSNLEATETATQTFGDAVVAKVPTDLQSAAESLIASAVAAIQSGEAAFSCS